jgi:hypothetical protein
MHRLLIILFLFVLSSCSFDEKANNISKQDEGILKRNIVNGDFDSIVAIEGTNGVYKFKNGELNHIVYFYDNQNMKYEIIKKDSVIPSQTDELIICKELHISYDKNGFVTERGCQGEYKSIGVPVGTWFKYQNNNLVQEIFYCNDTIGKDYILYKNIDDQGNIEELITNNFILYETDSTRLSNHEYSKRKNKLSKLSGTQ